MTDVQQVRPPTIADVARLAQVSLPTVSRVLTGSTPVRDHTRSRVLAAMKELNFRPNGAARALVKGRQKIVGVVARDVTTYGETQTIRAIEEAARRTGHVVAIAVLDPDDLSATGPAVELLLAQPIVGVVVLDFHHYDQTDLLTRLSGIPMAILTSDHDTNLPHVAVDDYKAARELTNYLLSLGHRNVHHVGVPGLAGLPHPREAGWRDALTANGNAPSTPIIGDWSTSSGRAAGAVLAHDVSVTAVMCANDELAFGVIRGLHDGGRMVPDEVSVTGMDDQPFAQVWVPDLTTYRLDWHQAGAEAFALLMDPDRQDSAESDSRLVVRGSTAPPAAPVAFQPSADLLVR